MRIVLAPDSFKENMTALQAAGAMDAGVRDAVPGARTVLMPMSDGGEGFVDAVAASWGADMVRAPSADALGRPIEAVYGLAGDRAVMDVAGCAGLERVAPGERDVLRSSTRGLGMLMAHALEGGARTLVIGLGGSATNDGGLGMLTELGVRLLDASGEPVGPEPARMGLIERIDLADLSAAAREATILVACDVTNPLTGPNGATAVFGPQKGVGADMVGVLDARLARLAELTGTRAEAAEPGAGAAGGLGFALRAFLGARMRPGVDLVAEAIGLRDAIARADLVLTGEGSVDEQTLNGKTPAGVARLAREEGVPCVVFAGRIKPGAEVLLDHGVRDLVKVGSPDEPLARALARGPENMREAVAGYLRARL
ncbi:glycerate kinase [Actinomyces sp. Chiba101]|uniref:Glycerate kinase n=1 Tax=Actinomyces denticolens TaxID=52767 RepID=A0ABY1HYU8_9ACTO|nr:MULTISPECIES: glycerate kinase [Actinomyces]BAW93636.1 glycerate kinase [Actinomyces sp. Chiba101]GAV93516.1 glycerate kinase [Actinomyces denticolens]SHI32745.1 glycerate kinase [Actinomyces denticolens]SUU74592.1 Glycerate kinase [Actinomyces denticolens]